MKQAGLTGSHCCCCTGAHAVALDPKITIASLALFPAAPEPVHALPCQSRHVLNRAVGRKSLCLYPRRQGSNLYARTRMHAGVSFMHATHAWCGPDAAPCTVRSQPIAAARKSAVFTCEQQRRLRPASWSKSKSNAAALWASIWPRGGGREGYIQQQGPPAAAMLEASPGRCLALQLELSQVPRIPSSR